MLSRQFPNIQELGQNQATGIFNSDQLLNGQETIMLEKEVKQLEDKIDTLLSSHRQLRKQNNLLLENQAQLSQDKTELLQKNDLARSKVEAMISRLKNLE